MMTPIKLNEQGKKTLKNLETKYSLNKDQVFRWVVLSACYSRIRKNSGECVKKNQVRLQKLAKEQADEYAKFKQFKKGAKIPSDFMKKAQAMYKRTNRECDEIHKDVEAHTVALHQIRLDYNTFLDHHNIPRGTEKAGRTYE